MNIELENKKKYNIHDGSLIYLNFYYVSDWNFQNLCYIHLAEYFKNGFFSKTYYYDIWFRKEIPNDKKIQEMFTAMLQCLYATYKEPTFFESLFCTRTVSYRKTKTFHLEHKPILILHNRDTNVRRQIPYEYHNYVGYNTQLSCGFVMIN